MTDPDLANRLGAYATGNLCNAHPEVRALGPAIAPLAHGTRLAGRARTARITPGQNASIHLAVHAAERGDVIVVEAGGDMGHGPFGDILATNCMNKGVAGLVIDGTVRDTAELREMGFPVFCRGANPTATQKTEAGLIDVPVTLAGVSVRPGDVIVGDDDGVVIVPAPLAQEVAESVARIAEKERSIFERLATGEDTKDIFGL